MEEIAAKKPNFFSQAWLVLVLALVYGAALAGVHLQLAPKIEQNKLNETLEKVPELVQWDESSPSSLESEQVTIVVGKKSYSVFKATANDAVQGWVAKSSATGYADIVEVLIGLSPDAQKVTGLFVLSQKETPGLGAKITDQSWLKHFIGKTTNAVIKVVKDGADEPHEIDSITGATISSDCVSTIVNKAVADLREPLAARIK